MRIARHLGYLFSVVVLAGSSCKDTGSDDGPVDPHAEQVDLCVTNCLKPLCPGNVTFSPGYEAECESRCEMRVDEAQDNSCAQEYEEVLTCLDGATCPEYYLWYEQEAGAPCSEREAELTALCPSIELRD